MQQAYFVITTINHERKAQKGPDVGENWREQKGRTTLRIA
jgi:hypothetical protein